MGESWHENELFNKLKEAGMHGRFSVDENFDFVFSGLEERVPLDGSKIDFERIHGSSFSICNNSELESLEFAEFFDERIIENHLEGLIYYVGDGCTNVRIKGEIPDFKLILHLIFQIPEHHYFVAEDFSWCMSFTMEGCMGFCKLI